MKGGGGRWERQAADSPYMSLKKLRMYGAGREAILALDLCHTQPPLALRLVSFAPQSFHQNNWVASDAMLISKAQPKIGSSY